MARLTGTLAVLWTGLSFAQMYSWTDATIGQRHLSEKAPPWFSTGKVVGPRTIVTLGPFLLDDTSLPAAERKALQDRGRALLAKHREEDEKGESDAGSARESRGNPDPLPPQPPLLPEKAPAIVRSAPLSRGGKPVQR